MAVRRQGLFSLYIYIENFIKNLLIRNNRTIFNILFFRIVPLVTLYQECSSHDDSFKIMAARGGLSFLYVYKET